MTEQENQENQENQEYQFYCLSFNNPTRKENMKRIFKTLEIDCIFNEGVDENDIRITGRNIYTKCWSCMYGHLDMISDFYYNSDKQFGIFCEDDIFIHKDLKILIPKIIEDFNIMKLDVLLLGCLLPLKLDTRFNYEYSQFRIKHSSGNYKFHEYPDSMWGAQMYMLSRTHAKKLLDKYSFSSGYADKTNHSNDNTLQPFSSDWTLTKDGNRALISPLLVSEDNKTNYEDKHQMVFHKKCFEAIFVPGLFIE